MTLAPNKAAAYRLYLAGALGNKLRTWAGVDELRASRYSGEVSARTKNGAAGRTQYRVTVVKGDPGNAVWPDVTYNESAPDGFLVLQGEVARLPGGLYLRYSTQPGLKMRMAMVAAKDAWRLRAKALLETRLWPASFDDLMELLDRFAVVEFSAYSRAVGDRAHRNTIFWEARDY